MTATSRRRPPGHDLAHGSVRFAAELVAWVATPWALWPHSIVLAIVAVALPRWRGLLRVRLVEA